MLVAAAVGFGFGVVVGAVGLVVNRCFRSSPFVTGGRTIGEPRNPRLTTFKRT